MTNDEAKAILRSAFGQSDRARERAKAAGDEVLLAEQEALDIALWLLERESGIAKVLGYYGANIDETDVLHAIDEVVEWEKKHPRPGSEGT